MKFGLIADQARCRSARRAAVELAGDAADRTARYSGRMALGSPYEATHLFGARELLHGDGTGFLLGVLLGAACGALHGIYVDRGFAAAARHFLAAGVSVTVGLYHWQFFNLITDADALQQQ